MFFPPCVPCLYALSQQSELLCVGHWPSSDRNRRPSSGAAALCLPSVVDNLPPLTRVAQLLSSLLCYPSAQSSVRAVINSFASHCPCTTASSPSSVSKVPYGRARRSTILPVSTEGGLCLPAGSFVFLGCRTIPLVPEVITKHMVQRKARKSRHERYLDWIGSELRE